MIPIDPNSTLPSLRSYCSATNVINIVDKTITKMLDKFTTPGSSVITKDTKYFFDVLPLKCEIQVHVHPTWPGLPPHRWSSIGLSFSIAYSLYGYKIRISCTILFKVMGLQFFQEVLSAGGQEPVPLPAPPAFFFGAAACFRAATSIVSIKG